MTPMQAAEILRKQLVPYAVPNSFSFTIDSKRADLQCVVENGKTVEVQLTPARITLALAFYRPDGVLVSIKVEEVSLEAIVETTWATVETLLKPLQTSSAARSDS